MKLLSILNKEFWKRWLKHYAPRRFNYAYATNVLKFRERKNKRSKRLGIIAVKKGHTRNKYLNPKLTKNGANISLPNYTKTRYWYLPKKYNPAIENLLSKQNYFRLIKAISKLYPGLSGSTIRKLASYFLNEKKKKKGREMFVVNKTVFDELNYIPKKEIDEVAVKMKQLKLKGDKL